MKTKIYGLFSSRDRVIRYIGKTRSLDTRLSQHLDETSNEAKAVWIKKELDEGHSIEIVTLIEDASPAFDEQRLLDVYGAPRGHTSKQLHNDLGLISTIPDKKPGQQPSGSSERQLIRDIRAANGLSVREAIRLRNERR